MFTVRHNNNNNNNKQCVLQFQFSYEKDKATEERLVLGKGGYSKVYSAIVGNTGKRLAVKEVEIKSTTIKYVNLNIFIFYKTLIIMGLAVVLPNSH